MNINKSQLLQKTNSGFEELIKKRAFLSISGKVKYKFQKTLKGGDSCPEYFCKDIKLASEKDLERMLSGAKAIKIVDGKHTNGYHGHVKVLGYLVKA
jgi:hypothetical protein